MIHVADIEEDLARGNIRNLETDFCALVGFPKEEQDFIHALRPKDPGSPDHPLRSGSVDANLARSMYFACYDEAMIGSVDCQA
jgi:hypothetical protein